MPQRVLERPPADRRSIGYNIKILSQLNHRCLQTILTPYDLTTFHWLVLRCLWKQDGLPVSDITQSLQEVGGTMTGVIDRMEERRLVSRVRDRQDRRVIRVHLSKKGKDLEKELMPKIEEVRKKLNKGINPKELEVAERVVEKLVANCQEFLESE